jgi:hypothetical protein
MGQPAKAHAMLAQILDIDPLSHFARFETYLLNPGAATLAAFRATGPGWQSRIDAALRGAIASKTQGAPAAKPKKQA